MTPRKKLAVLISGRGSNMEAILKATQVSDYPAEIAIVISDNPEAKGLETARNNGIKANVFDQKDYADKTEHETAISMAVESTGADIICLAGFMRILSAGFVARFTGMLINIHPSLLPAYKGLDTHARALADGAAEHGCTVHFVNEEMDGGAIIAQAVVPVRAGDTEGELSARVLKQEHRLYPHVVKLLADGRIALVGGKTLMFDFNHETQGKGFRYPALADT